MESLRTMVNDVTHDSPEVTEEVKKLKNIKDPTERV